ncbi:MAG: hypothetical protein JEZ03_01350, partial [Bacteroidales bacterium]|nr:hypothetical protein [Bacteroidales bacterium]
ILISVVLSLSFCLSSFAQEVRFQNIETRLSFLGEIILSIADDSSREDANMVFLTTLEKVLKDPNSFSYPFDNVPNLAVLTPEDSSFRIFNWNFPGSDSEFTFHAIIQKKENDTVKIFILSDHSDDIVNPEHQELNPDNWYGALYYQIIQKQFNGQKTYTLLGWDGFDRYSNKKIIEILCFENNEPIFGKAIFPDWNNTQQLRVIFEYNERSAFSLRYDDQALIEKTRKNKIRPGEGMYNYNEIPTGMIAFNRLEPMHPELQGDFKYYIARSELVDGFVFENGFWHFHSEVDAQNRQMQDTSFQRPDDLNLFPEKKEDRK